MEHEITQELTIDQGIEQARNSAACLFRDPDDWQEIYDWIHAHSPEDRPHLMTVAYMAFNLGKKYNDI